MTVIVLWYVVRIACVPGATDQGVGLTGGATDDDAWRYGPAEVSQATADESIAFRSPEFGANSLFAGVTPFLWI